MVRTTIVLPEEDFRELKRLATEQDRPISWLLRQAFRLSKVHLERGEAYGSSFDRIWNDIGRSLRRGGVGPRAVAKLVAEVRGQHPRKSRKGAAR